MSTQDKSTVVMQGTAYKWATQDQKQNERSGHFLWVPDEDKERLEQEDVLVPDDNGVLCYNDGCEGMGWVPVEDHCVDCGTIMHQCECDSSDSDDSDDKDSDDTDDCHHCYDCFDCSTDDDSKTHLCEDCDEKRFAMNHALPFYSV